jgi:tRNA1(Val) A37 N6-methylase TrmN6
MSFEAKQLKIIRNISMNEIIELLRVSNIELQSIQFIVNNKAKSAAKVFTITGYSL